MPHYRRLLNEEIRLHVEANLALKIMKHAPQRRLSLNKSCGVVIRLRHQLGKVRTLKDDVFSLDQSSNWDDILQLYSIMEPVLPIALGGQHGSVPMIGEMHMGSANPSPRHWLQGLA